MHQTRIRMSIACGILALTALAALAGATWVEDGGRGFDVAELADGEVRMFGDAPQRITVVRQGDEAVVTREATAERPEQTTRCRIGRDACRIVTPAGERGRVALVVGGPHERAWSIDVGRRASCDDGDDCAEVVIHRVGTPGSMHEKDALDGATEFDLAELMDGESRVFGEGARTLTATREGDVVGVRREGGGEPTHEVECLLPGDVCKVLTFEQEPERIGLIVRRQRECEAGQADCVATEDVDVLLEDDAPGARRHVVRVHR